MDYIAIHIIFIYICYRFIISGKNSRFTTMKNGLHIILRYKDKYNAELYLSCANPTNQRRVGTVRVAGKNSFDLLNFYSDILICILITCCGFS